MQTKLLRRSCDTSIGVSSSFVPWSVRMMRRPRHTLDFPLFLLIGGCLRLMLSILYFLLGMSVGELAQINVVFKVLLKGMNNGRNCKENRVCGSEYWALKASEQHSSGKAPVIRVGWIDLLVWSPLSGFGTKLPLFVLKHVDWYSCIEEKRWKRPHFVRWCCTSSRVTPMLCLAGKNSIINNNYARSKPLSVWIHETESNATSFTYQDSFSSRESDPNLIAAVSPKVKKSKKRRPTTQTVPCLQRQSDPQRHTTDYLPWIELD